MYSFIYFFVNVDFEQNKIQDFLIHEYTILFVFSTYPQGVYIREITFLCHNKSLRFDSYMKKSYIPVTNLKALEQK